MSEPIHVKSEPSEETVDVPPPRGEGSFVASNDDEDDEVVREIDVFLSPALASQVYLVQFPLQHQPVVQPDGARIKKRHCMLELDQPLPSNIEQNGVFPMTHRIYNSHTISVSTHMALGKLAVAGGNADEDGNGGSGRTALHLVPLSNIKQMRPSFAHVDEAMPGVGMETPETKQDSKQQFRKESERTLLARKTSYAYKKTSEDSEPWQNLNVCGQDSEQYQHLMDEVVCPSQETYVRDTTAKKHQQDKHQHPNVSYVRTLNYLPTSRASTDQDAIDNDAFDATGLCAKLTTLLRNGSPVPYSLLRYKFPESVDDEAIMYALGGCAVMVRGNFILHSRLLDFPRSIQQARTFIMFLLQTFGCIHRSRLSHAFSDNSAVTSNILNILLEQVGKKTRDGWKLRVEDDINFCKLYPDYSLNHAQYWVRQAERFQELLEAYTMDPEYEEEEEEEKE